MSATREEARAEGVPAAALPQTDPVGMAGLFVMALPLVLPLGESYWWGKVAVIFSIGAQLLVASVLRGRKSRRQAEEARARGRTPGPVLDHGPALRGARTLLLTGILAGGAMYVLGILFLAELLMGLFLLSRMAP